MGLRNSAENKAKFKMIHYGEVNPEANSKNAVSRLVLVRTMVITRASGAPAEGMTRAEDEEDGLSDADRSTLYNLFKEDHQ